MKLIKKFISLAVLATLVSSNIVVINAESENTISTEIENNAENKISKAITTGLYDVFLVYEDGSLWKSNRETGVYKEILKDKKSNVKKIVKSSTWSNIDLVLLEDGTLVLYEDNADRYRDDYTQILASGINDVFYEDHDNFVITNDNKLVLMTFEDLENSDIKYKKTTQNIMNDVKSIDAMEGQASCLILKTNGDLLSFKYSGSGGYVNSLKNPKNFTKILTNVKDAKNQDYYSFILKNDGNSYYYSSYDGISDYNKKINLLASDVKAIETKKDAVYLLKNDNTLWVGGSDYKFYSGDYIGNGDYGIEALKKHGLEQIADNVAEVSASEWNTLVVKEDGTLLGMGENFHDTITSEELQISDKFDENGFYTIMTDVKDFSINRFTTVAVTEDGNLYGFGRNDESVLVDDIDIDEIGEPLLIDTDVKWADLGYYTLFYTKGDNYALKQSEAFKNKYLPTNVKMAEVYEEYYVGNENTYFYLTNDNKLFKVVNDVPTKLSDNIIDFSFYGDYIAAINTKNTLVFDNLFNTTTYPNKEFDAKFKKDAKFRESISYWTTSNDYKTITVYSMKDTLNFKTTDITGVAEIVGQFPNANLKMVNGDVYDYVKANNMFGEKRDSYKNAFEKLDDGIKSYDQESFSYYYIDGNDALWGTGDNSYGQIGDISINYFEEPVKIMDGVKDFEASESSLLILTKDGTLLGRGANIYGELGFEGQGYAFTNKYVVELLEMDIVREK